MVLRSDTMQAVAPGFVSSNNCKPRGLCALWLEELLLKGATSSLIPLDVVGVVI